MERRDFFKLIGSVSALGLLSGCAGKSQFASSGSNSWPIDDGIQIKSGGPWDARLNPTCDGQPPVNSVNLGSSASQINRTTQTPPPCPINQPTKAHKQGMTAIGRNSWHAKGVISSRMRAMNGVQKITVHHEGNPKPNYDTTPAQVAGSLRQIQKVHFSRLKAGDIAYHFVVDRLGLVWQGRSLKYQGAHTRGNNPHNIGIMCLGNFEIQQPSTRQLITLADLCATLCAGYKISPWKIYGHRELRSTACPGKNLFPRLCTIRDTLRKA